jgi:hypothetical protein
MRLFYSRAEAAALIDEAARSTWTLSHFLKARTGGDA